MIKTDEYYMQLALDLAVSAKGNTNPNPMVGAVIVQNGVIVGTGLHRKAGEPHAEVHAFRMAGEHAKGATLYVTLEPCSHYGKTPPCANLVKESGVKRVVIAMEDPNPSVAGRGVKLLRDAGIEVEVGILEAQAYKLNERFIHNMLTSRPFVVSKYAMTADGKIAVSNGDSRWVTGDDAREDVHEYRHEMDGILVGIGTVLADDPSLTTRLVSKEGKNPIRIILDRQLRTPLHAKVAQTADAKTIIVTAEDAAIEKAQALQAQGVEILRVATTEGQLHLEEMLDALYTRGITDILVEGGAAVHASFFRQHLVQKVLIYMAPKIIGGAHSLSPVSGPDVEAMSAALEFEYDAVDVIGNDLRIVAYPKK
ncbi:bifunctional diaminohydroxyphosphoribosylaminopyrimidine deaminase/5-amino-6-(5-phosphoribosylamino)uracil reductase RibD [Kurthia senegalensis]|uniref:bifunctional diaminohydroxyphosphoribosylaminopyrimidine deaminase/5-amino-6-(5-phosphoribosylamino)uracil reductase RibD n=1 Tax=Kurthia senegalensis TaxID=1033740 RepID=UPI00028828B7|nr:bifunctional diaminohydroxyphosphoribosylaminopyrimidine deaminase/5-amino-6-(5-phosphoribosylamino)uracil reductase RibD [Kurthia senegalensis]